MKNLKSILFTLTLALSTLASCSSDDSTTSNQNQPEPQNELLGKWNLEIVNTQMLANGIIIFDEKDITAQEKGLVIQYEFFENNTIEYIYSTTNSGQTSPVTESSTGTYFLNDDKLTLNINTNDTYTIKLLDAKNLHLNLKTEETREGINFQIDMTQKFTKL